MQALLRPTSKVLLLAAFACTFLVVAAEASAGEVVARGARDGILALNAKGTPSVAYVRGNNAFIATRVKTNRWRKVKMAPVPAGSRVMAFAVGAKGPVTLIQNSDARATFVLRARGSGWQTIRIAGGLASTIRLGWPGLALDRNGLPVIAYTRWNSVNLNTQLLLVRIDAGGRMRSQRITAEGFPKSYVPPPAAPVIVGKRVHVVEPYGYGSVVGAFEWYPERNTWSGIGIDVGRGEFPLGRVLAGLGPGGTLYAAWTQTMYALDAAPVTLAERSRGATSEFILDRALTTGLALPASGAEVAANEWVEARELGLDGDDTVWAGTIISRAGQLQVDGWIAGLALAPNGGRDVLLERAGAIEWFHSPRKLSTRLSIEATHSASGVAVHGHVEGASSGKVTLYRERPGAARVVAATMQLNGGSFSFLDESTSRPFLYRAVYTDPKTGIPYAALLSRPIR